MRLMPQPWLSVIKNERRRWYTETRLEYCQPVGIKTPPRLGQSVFWFWYGRAVTLPSDELCLIGES